MVAVLFACAGLTTRPARADKPAPPYSYAKTTSDGRFVFVMIAPGSVDVDAGPWEGAKAREIRLIRATFHRSGLYRRDDWTEPLWTVDWYASDVNIASDGIHLVRHGPWASSYSEEAVSFFANGNLIRTYRIGELIRDPKRLPHTVSHFDWEIYRDRRFDEGTWTYALQTREGKWFVFDIRTGEIVSHEPPPEPPSVLESPKTWIGPAIGLLSLVAALIWRARRARRRPVL